MIAGRDGTGRDGRFTKKLARDVLVVLEVSQRASWMRCPNPNTKRSNLPILASTPSTMLCVLALAVCILASLVLQLRA